MNGKMGRHPATQGERGQKTQRGARREFMAGKEGMAGRAGTKDSAGFGKVNKIAFPAEFFLPARPKTDRVTFSSPAPTQDPIVQSVISPIVRLEKWSTPIAKQHWMPSGDVILISVRNPRAAAHAQIISVFT